MDDYNERKIKVSITRNDKGNSVSNNKETVHQYIDYKDKYKEDTEKYIYSFPKLIIRGLVSISLIYFIGTIAIMWSLKIIGVSADVNNLINNLAVFDLLSTGIAIVAIAVSVWVGLNVYNFISRDEMKEVTKTINAQKTRLEENNTTVERLSTKAISLENQLKGVQDLALQEFVSAVSRSGEKYIISAYFADYFLKNKLDPINTEMIFQLTTAELLYDDLTEYYEKGRLGDCYETSHKVQELFENYRRSIDELSFEENNIKNMILAYLDSRIADTLFYKNMSKKERSFEKEMKQVAELFEDILTTINSNPNYKEAEACKAYCYNTIGYTYDQLYLNDKNNADYLQKAIENSENAIKDAEKLKLPPRTRARYNRNLGLIFDHKKEYRKALEYYREAVKYDIKDYKGWVAIASAIIKEIESNTGISNRDKLLRSYGASQFKEYCIDLKEAKNAALFSMRLNPGFIDPYNKLITVYIFEILSDKDSGITKKAKEAAEEYIEFLDGLGCSGNGFLFAKRNYYEAIGDINSAYKINEDIIDKDPDSAKNFDCFTIKSMYEHKPDNDPGVH